jgi:hypothetical protein
VTIGPIVTRSYPLDLWVDMHCIFQKLDRLCAYIICGEALCHMSRDPFAFEARASHEDNAGVLSVIRFAVQLEILSCNT